MPVDADIEAMFHAVEKVNSERWKLYLVNSTDLMDDAQQVEALRKVTGCLDTTARAFIRISRMTGKVLLSSGEFDKQAAKEHALLDAGVRAKLEPMAT